MKIKDCFLILLLSLLACTEEAMQPESNQKESYELQIISPENKIYSKTDYLKLKFSFFSDISDSVEIDSAHWYSDLQGRVDWWGYKTKTERNCSILKTGSHILTCKVFKNARVFKKSILVEISDQLYLHSKDLGRGWERLYFTKVSDLETKINCYKVKFDNNGDMYLSTVNLGLIYKDEKVWRHYTRVDGFTDHVYEFLVEDGKIIAGDFHYNFLYFYENNEWTQLEFEAFMHSFDDVHSIAKDPLGRYWVGLHSGEAIIYDNGKILPSGQPQRFARSDQIIIKNNKIYFLGEFSNIWTLENGIWEEIVIPGGAFAAWEMRVTDDGTIWVAGEYGLYKYKDGNAVKIPESENSVLNERVKRVLLDSKNRIWATTSYGISVKDGNEWKNFPGTMFGYQSNEFPCFFLQEDHLGNIWFVNGDELLKYSGN